MKRRRCNEPRKPRFRDRIAAALWAERGGIRYGENQEPYRCPAGHWHARTVAKQRSRHA